MTNSKSEVYTAIYSGIQVFEMSVGDCTMMRRRSDSYLNATQILKLGGLDKGKRTKVLEREVMSKTHEKIQGGYGKYQGTWVPLEIGRDLAERYEVLHLLLPLFDFDPSTWDELPEKEQMPPRVSRTRINHGHSSQSHPSPPSSPSYSSQQTGLTLGDSFKRKLVPLENTGNWPSKTAATSAPPLSQSTIAPNAKKRTRLQVQPKKRQPTEHGNDTDNNDGDPLASPARPTISRNNLGNDTDVERNRNALLSIFSPNEDDLIPSFFYGAGATAGIDWDIPIDEYGNTALHWSVSLGRMHTVEWLIAKGANVVIVNLAGETPLMRGVMTTCIYDHDCFPHMLDILWDSISLADYAGRTVLHHIILSTLETRTTANPSTIRSSTPSSSNPPSVPVPSTIASNSSASSTTSTQHEDRLLAAKSYMIHALKVIGQHSDHSYILNQPDSIGDTPYGLACRLNCTDICDLMEQCGCSLVADISQPRTQVSSFSSLPLPIPAKHTDQSCKRPRKKTERTDKTDYLVDDLENKTSTKGQELVSTVQRIADSMDMEFYSKLQAKELDIARLQQEIRNLTRQLDDVHKQPIEPINEGARQLEQAYSKIKHLENLLDRTGIKDLESETVDSTHNNEIQQLATTRDSERILDREKQLETQILHLQSQLMDSNNNPQGFETLSQNHAQTLESLTACKRLIAICCNLPLEKVDDFIGPLTMAIENDPPDLDFARVIGFMEQLQHH